MITSLRIQDFKGHRDTEVPLGRLTVLVGPNGAGKTSVLEALWLESQLVEHVSPDVLRGDWAPDDLRRRGAEGPIVLALQGTETGKAWSARLEIKGLAVELKWQAGDGSPSYKGHVHLPNRNAAVAAAERLGPVVLYKLDARNIAAAAYSDQLGPAVAFDGTNTAVTLAAIKLGHDDVQIVATTHSPYILDELDPADVHAFALRDDGTVAAKRLSKHPQAERMKGALTAGQLWSLDPERSWVLRQGEP